MPGKMTIEEHNPSGLNADGFGEAEQGAPRKRPFQSADWLELGLAALSAGGAEAVKLAPICAAAGLTRGSFYYHFADHDTFLLELAETWIEGQTVQSAALLKALRDPAATAEGLREAGFAIDYRLELGFRELARRHGAVAAVVKRTDNMRLSVLADLCAARFGLEPPAAWDLAHLEYAAFAGLVLVDPKMSEARLNDLRAHFDRMISGFFATRDLETQG